MGDTYDPGSRFRRMSSPYGWRIHPITKRTEFHPGADFSAPEGTPIPSAASGVVVYSGKNEGGYGNAAVVKNDTGDYSLYAHMQGGNQVEPGQKVWKGDTIGLVGNTGTSDGPHLHYSVITKEAGKIYDPFHPGSGGPIGLHLDQTNTYNPGTYKDYLPSAPYLDQSRRASEILSGLDEKSSRSGGSTPDRPGDRFFNPFNQAPVAGFVPLPNAPVASDDPAIFADRYGNWAAKPGLDNNNSAPAPQLTPSPGKRSEADDDVPVRVRSRVNASPASASGDAPPPASAPPLPGIFSGKPMRDYPVRPSIFATDDRSSPDDDELYQRWRRWLDA